MGHRDSSTNDSGAGGVRAAGGGADTPAALHPEYRAQLRTKGMSRAARVLLFAVHVYQSFFSALMPSACKFYPSCSHYAAEALRIHGARHGSWLALRRVLRCHPFTRGGVDLVPDSTDFPKSRTGFSLSDFFVHGSKPKQAEAGPTKEVRS
jgi:putative membrane protein insertion efficiency factor